MKIWYVVGALLALIADGAYAGSNSKAGGPVEQSADALLIGIPAIALGLTWLIDKTTDGVVDGDTQPGASLNFGEGFTEMMSFNGSPRHDLGIALARSIGVSYGLKYAVDEERPNGKSGSFPSAHAAITFTGAEFIRKEYGWGWGAPAYVAAGYVGWSRVQTDHHFGRDVLAGAAIGILSNHEFNLSWLKIKPIFVPSGGDSPYKDSFAPGRSADLRDANPGLGFRIDF